MRFGGAKKLKKHAKKVFDNLFDDIASLANFCLDKESWHVLHQLFLKKWTDKVPKKIKSVEAKAALKDTVEYFNDNWCIKEHCRRWYAGCNRVGPSSNNAIEANNRILKSPGFSDHKSLGAEELFELVMFLFSPLF